jgi:Metallo-peptidase family M12B Reprolysin-like/PKD-like domain
MKKIVLIMTAVLSLISLRGYAQNDKNYWEPVSAVKNKSAVVVQNKLSLIQPKLYELDIEGFKTLLTGSPKRANESNRAGNTVSFPDADGVLETYSVFESSNMDPALAAKYPDIKSYVGKGINDPTAMIYFSVSPLGLQTMLLRAVKECVIIEPYTKDQSTYAVYKKSENTMSLSRFECKVIGQAKKQIGLNEAANRPNADDGTLRTYRLALSANGEYTQYFGGTVAGALAAMNATMTRVNGIFEKDFAIRMVLIANTDLLIYTNPATDPYNTLAYDPPTWNTQLQNNLDAVIGNANYDIGHLFGTDPTAGGNAGCVGCVCETGTKGRGFSAFADPVGDVFDIDFLSHEFGHQFGASHTFTYQPVLEGSIAQVEPGSGVTIMSYAGYTGATDILTHPYPYFHSISVQQVTDYIKTTTCQVNTPTGNAIPTANAGADYTIPKGTPFKLTGSATDANDASLLYNWEQIDVDQINNTPYPNVTDVSGPEFRNFNLSSNNTRTFPELATVLAGATSSTWEAVPNVGRTLNFRFIVRDNHVGGSANNSDDMVVTTAAASGPFIVTAPNTAVTWAGGSTHTITWNVANSTAAPVSCANVKISLSTDGGNTFPTVLLASTSNDGSQAVTLPNVITTTARIKVEAVGNIFFDISNTNFSINTTTCNFPATAGAISGPSKVCKGQSGFVYTVPVIAYATSYVWTLPSGMAPVSGGLTTTLNKITVKTSNSFNSGSITVKGSNTCGFGMPSPPFSVTLFTSAPSRPTAINNLTGIAYGYCPGNTYTFTTTATNATSFIWEISCGNILSGQGTSTVTVRLSNSCSDCEIKVKASNCLGTSSKRELKLESVLPQPSISGPSYVCKNTNSVATYTAICTNGATSYTWSSSNANVKFSTGGTATNPLTTTSASVTVNFAGVATGNRNVRVTANNSCGSSGMEIKYVTVANCNSPLTRSAKDIKEGIAQEDESNFKVFPNPTSGSATIVFNAENAGKKFNLEFRDMTGKVLTTRSGIANEGVNIQKLDISRYAAAQFIVMLSLEGETPRTIKLLKAN